VAIRHAAFANLKHGAPLPQCVIHKLPSDVAEYLEEHVEKLVDKANADEAPPGTLDPNGRTAFDEMQTAAETRFGQLATNAAVSIQGAMDRRANDGLFVALQLDGASPGPTVAVLKLEALGRAAQLRTSGGVPLAIVKGLVDEPGELQMGAAFPDKRTSSDVIVGKRTGPAALYFLTALGIEQMENARAATAQIVKTVYKMKPDRADEIAQRLASTTATTAAGFVDTVPDVLNSVERQELKNSFKRPSWPIVRIAPATVSIKRTLRADGITITGTVNDMKKVRVTPLPGGGAKIEIEVSTAPKEQYG
jgi:hypothetical protein